MSLKAEIRKSFSGFTLDINLEADQETLGLLGESGCGKTLTMRCIAGIETPDAGKIVVNDKVYFDKASGKKPSVNLTAQERKTALLFQNYMLFPNLTVAENVGAGISNKASKSELKDMVERELERFGIDKFADRYPAQLSGGQQQRVALARMLAARPGILMLDEPFSALDSHLKGILEQNLSAVFEMFAGTILYVSHDIDEALRFCNRIAVMEDGKVMEISKGDELVSNPRSTASVKLSGCKNVTEAIAKGKRRIYMPRWGVEMQTARDVPEGLKNMGIRAFFLERVEEPKDSVGAAASTTDNVFRMRCDRVSDSRFDRTVILGFCDADKDDNFEDDAVENEMTFLHNHVFWRVDKLAVEPEQLPELGEELWIRFPPEKIYLVDR